eukprot:TRINITY_DN3412_c0_g3_i1.p1 TRINITY_DN3412_c0_g3~~TRINITY_DN3412_c0_g3_i1.p1  ORF type:complete len:794 (-),score=156.23 TRINITY_DN3412_c0_g3_i1:376-2757(-)
MVASPATIDVGNYTNPSILFNAKIKLSCGFDIITNVKNVNGFVSNFGIATHLNVYPLLDPMGRGCYSGPNLITIVSNFTSTQVYFNGFYALSFGDLASCSFNIAGFGGDGTTTASAAALYYFEFKGDTTLTTATLKSTVDGFMSKYDIGGDSGILYPPLTNLLYWYSAALSTQNDGDNYVVNWNEVFNIQSPLTTTAINSPLYVTPSNSPYGYPVVRFIYSDNGFSNTPQYLTFPAIQMVDVFTLSIVVSSCSGASSGVIASFSSGSITLTSSIKNGNRQFVLSGFPGLPSFSANLSLVGLDENMHVITFGRTTGATFKWYVYLDGVSVATSGTVLCLACSIQFDSISTSSMQACDSFDVAEIIAYSSFTPTFAQQISQLLVDKYSAPSFSTLNNQYSLWLNRENGLSTSFIDSNNRQRVHVWRDNSPSGNNATAIGEDPYYDSPPSYSNTYIEFNGINSSMRIRDTGSSKGQLALFLVAGGAKNTVSQPIIGGNLGDGYNPQISTGSDQLWNYRLQYNAGAIPISVCENTGPVNIITILTNTTYTSSYFNGQYVRTRPAYAGVTGYNTTNNGFGFLGGTSSYGFSTGSISEIIAYPTPIMSTVVSNIHWYLNNKYNPLAANLQTTGSIVLYSISSQTTAGGSVYILGRNFQNRFLVNILIGTQTCTNPSWINKNNITCVAPPGLGVNLVTSFVGNTILYSYLPPTFTSTTIYALQTGSPITIIGTSFGNDKTQITLSSNSPTSLSPLSLVTPHTTLTCSVPPGSGSFIGYLTVAGQRSINNFTVIYVYSVLS